MRFCEVACLISSVACFALCVNPLIREIEVDEEWINGWMELRRWLGLAEIYHLEE